jgi:predicted TIM-barrel fold metal-dependent hydrolase
LVSCIGEDAIVIASDYPHHDPSTEEDMVRAIMERDDLPIRVREKILSDNPQRLYNLTSV